MPVNQAGLNAILQSGTAAVTFADPIEEDEVVRPAEQIADAQIAFCSCLPANLEAMPRLEFVQIASSGYTQLLPHRLPERGVRVSNARGVFDTAIAEWNIAMMVNLARNLRQMIRHQDAGIWDRAACFQTEIRGATVGLWGYGGIARQTARLCKSLGLRVHALTRSGSTARDNAYCVENSGDVEGTLPDRIFCMAEKFEFLRDLDFLILCTPHTAQTEGMVGGAELDALPERAYLLNPARGVLVQEGPLIVALRSNSIAGAAIDTHYQYPLPPEHPLWKMSNVILTPHISGSSQSPYFLNRIWDLFAQNVARLHAGEPLLNELSPRELLNLS